MKSKREEKKMDQQKRPRAREKKVVSEGKGVEKKGQGLGTGPVGNGTSRPQSQTQQPAQPQRSTSSNPFAAPSSSGTRPAAGQSSVQRPASSNPFAAPSSSGTRPAAGQGSAQRPTNSNPFAAPNSSGTRPAAGQSSAQRPAQPQRPAAGGNAGNAQRATTSQGTQRASGGGGGKLLPLIAVLVLLLGGGQLSGLFGGGDDSSSLPSAPSSSQTTSSSSYPSSTSSSSSSGADAISSLLGGGTSSSGGLSDLLSAFMSSSGSSVYDYTGSSVPASSGNDFFSLLSSSMGGSGSSSSASFGGGSTSANTLSGASASTAQVDETVASGARAKRTQILGNQKDTVTILMYMCGTDLESQNGMGTADLKEMANATVGDQVNLIVYTGGCRRWKNNVISNTANQIYQIKNGSLYCLEKDMGTGAMTSPATLTKFIQYGAENFPANRMELILWDHGGGSVSGFGYDEKFSSSGSMNLAGINNALKNAGVTFDFIGFDACLMATVENGIMLEQYADYLIASEETEPGVGWYYTNWLNKLSANTSLPTVQVGKMIADDFVSVCNQQCRGQSTTLSVVDLAELKATVPAELKAFSVGANELIQNQEYAKVSKARSSTREFGQSSQIDQIDLVHFANNLGTSEGKQLAQALQGAVKYNRTGGGISNAYGLSIYFPYRKASKVSQAVSAYQAIGMDEDYARCIQEFASLEVSGQVAAGTPVSSYGSFGGYGSAYGSQSSLLSSLMGGGYSGGYTSSQDSMTDLLGGLFGGGSSGGIYDLFGGRNLTAETAAQYIADHHLNAAALVWTGDRITLSESQWAEVEDIALNVFVDDGEGYIDLGLDNLFTIDGNDLVYDFDNTWISIDGQPVAYYYLGTVENGEEEYLISGYIPALLNGQRVKLMLNFDHNQPYGYLAGAELVYTDAEIDVQAKNLIQVGAGDQLQFLCDYYDYEGNYKDSYFLGDPITLGEEVEIANTPIGGTRTLATWKLTDIYQQPYWTPSWAIETEVD